MLALFLAVARAQFACWPLAGGTGQFVIVTAAPAKEASGERHENRLALALANGYDYCQYDAPTSLSTAAKLEAMHHALYVRGYEGAWWIDAALQARTPITDTMAELVAPLLLTQLDCVFSLPRPTRSVARVGESVFFLRRGPWAFEFIASAFDALTTFADRVSARPDEFALQPDRGSACTVVPVGVLEPAPLDGRRSLLIRPLPADPQARGGRQFRPQAVTELWQ